MPCVLGYLASNAMELQVSVNPQEWSQGTPPSLREAGEGRAIVPCALVAAVVAGMVVQMPVASSTCNVHVCVCACACACACACVCERGGHGLQCSAIRCLVDLPKAKLRGDCFGVPPRTDMQAI